MLAAKSLWIESRMSFQRMPRRTITILEQFLAGTAIAWLGVSFAPAADWVRFGYRLDDFPLFHEGRSADLVYAAADFAVVALAVTNLAGDL
jgi:hypothetical protein